MMSEERSKELHVCFTPYHVFLASLIAWARRGQAESRLVLVEYRFDASILRECLRSWEASPFSDLLSLKTIPWWLNRLLVKVMSADRAETYRTYLRAGKNLRRIIRYVEEFAPTRVHVYNDRPELCQGAMRTAKNIHPACRCAYVEDGSAAYVRIGAGDSESRKRRLFRKLFIGAPWLEDLPVLGTSRWIDESMVLFPELRVPELKKYPSVEIPRDALGDAEFLRWNEVLLERYGVSRAMTSDVGCILALPSATGYEDIATWKSVIDVASEAMRRQGLRVAIKYHPREYLGDYLGVAARADVLTLPQQISMENMVLQLLPHLKCMIGDSSSCLMSAKWMSPCLKVIACTRTTKHAILTGLLPSLRGAGCEVAASEDELRMALPAAARATSTPAETGDPLASQGRVTEGPRN
jgi:hypothetical protein